MVTVGPEDIEAEVVEYDDEGVTESEAVISVGDVELIVSSDPHGQRVFWRREGDTEPRGQLAGREPINQ